jgi:hypothetical protein
MSLTKDIILIIASFCSYRDILSISFLKQDLYLILSDKNAEFWHELCNYHELQQQSSTRTRGKKSWRDLYVSYLCCECFAIGRGTIVFDINGGSQPGSVISQSKSLAAVCLPCFQYVRSYISQADRKQYCLLRLKGRNTFLWANLLVKIPTRTKKETSKEEKYRHQRNDRRANINGLERQLHMETNKNDHLVKKLLKFHS